MNGQRMKYLLFLITGLALGAALTWFLRGALYHDVILVETENRVTASQMEPSTAENLAPFRSPEVTKAAEEAKPVKTSEPSVQVQSAVEEIPAEEADSGRIDLNAANAEELQTLPGIGEVLAGRIIDYREEHGRFQFAEELMNVKGIGEKTFAKIAEYVEVR